MSAGLTKRDIQSAKSQAWHGRTNIVDIVTRENSMPFEIIESPIYYKVQKPHQTIPDFTEDVMIESPEFKQLIANDDFLPIGEPYGLSYHPSSVDTFWKVIAKGMDEVPFEIASAGTVDNRCKLFASLKVDESFRIGDRTFDDFITVIDSYDKSTSFQARYTNICIVCANTFQAAMMSGQTIGKAKHTLNLEINIERLILAMRNFTGTRKVYQEVLTNADRTACSPDEARTWLAGIEGRNANTCSNGLKQKTARMMELFAGGRGNAGATRLDAFSALTDFHSNESSNRKGEGAQYYSSNWGTSAQVKTLAITGLERDWTRHIRHGERLLNEDKSLLTP
jgi:hypothetical protein